MNLYRWIDTKRPHKYMLVIFDFSEMSFARWTIVSLGTWDGINAVSDFYIGHTSRIPYFGTAFEFKPNFIPHFEPIDILKEMIK